MIKRRVKENKVLTFEERKYINKALEEIQAYRAIGTVEECQQRKDYIDTINEILKDYSDIGTIDECRVAVERMKPKNWIAEEMYDFDVIWQCPACKEYQVLMEGTPQDNEYNFCPKCGQALAEEKSN